MKVYENSSFCLANQRSPSVTQHVVSGESSFFFFFIVLKRDLFVYRHDSLTS